MYFRAVGCYPGPIKQTIFAEIHVMQKQYSLELFGGGQGSRRKNSSSGMAAVVVEIAHRHTLRFKQQSTLTTSAAFAKHCRLISASAF